uniref:MIR domain-containing protein n=1 Tax=Macrostomum lignano TaxID=282301 RepID=A0A1I8HBP4_9PLAT
MEIAKADDTLCIGDYVSLYSGDAQGYVYAMLSSTTFAYLAVNSQESRDQPLCGDIQLLSFKICAINRYKLLKEYNRLHQFHKDSKDKVRQVLLEQAKLSAEAEAHDNDMEQARQRGKKVLYGQMIQLQHAFTGKYVHISTQNTSPTESSNMQVTLNPDNAGAAQFKVMPRFKVKGEGDLVQIEDQVILESVKSPGQYLHVGRVKCKQYIPVYENSFELNLSVRYSGLTLVRRFTEHEKETKNIRAGQPIRFFHTELEAYLVCEGSFNEVDQSKPKTLMKPSSAICYWQLELVENAISGGTVKWKQQVRIRHMCTRKFLSLSPKGDLALTDDRTDANTVFRLHQVLKKTTIGEAYRVEMTQKSQCDDAFTIYAVEPQLVNIFNYVAGYVPLIQRFIFDHKTGSSKLEPIITQPMVKALLELRDFIVFDIDNNKNRTKLLRNLRLVDLLFRVLQIPLSGSSQTVQQLLLIFEECYDLIYQYLYGESRKNELYCARYLDFLHQLRL